MPAITADNPLSLPAVDVTDPAAVQRAPLYRVDSTRTFEGEGFPVRRPFPGIARDLVDPFILLDQMGEVQYAPGEAKGAPSHPHRGFETVTYMIDGEFEHRDSTGGGGIIRDGATQWMTAGAGIVHSELPPEHLVRNGGLFHGIQLWVNLPRAKKWARAAYQNIEADSVTLLRSTDGGALIRVIAGEIAGHRGPGVTQTPIAYAHVSLAAGARLDVPWPKEFNALLYALGGFGSVGVDGVPLESGQLAVFGPGDALRVAGGAAQDSRTPTFEVLLLGGLPIREPVVQYGPFVMNTREEILQAFEDYRSGRMGSIPAIERSLLAHKGAGPQDRRPGSG
ncbi:MAG: pirin family protein [Chloroflexi bacterium]|nr:pirin family protein [Chloroflexota bacterium]